MSGRLTGTPQSELDADPELLRLSRPTPGRRILAWIIDRLVTYGPFVVLWLVTDYALNVALLHGAAPFRPHWVDWVIDVAPIIGIASIPTLLVVQVVLLVRRGQTIAMRSLGMRIVGTDDGRAGFVRIVLIRLILPDLLFGLPVVGWVLLIADFVSLWTADRRCLHDRLSGTKVIFAVSGPEPSAKTPSRLVATLKRMPVGRILTVIGVVAAAGTTWQVWRKWPPTMSDIEKICRVTELSRCPEQAGVAFSICELGWLNRATWSNATIKELLDLGREDGPVRAWHSYAAVLRSGARENHLRSCPRAYRFELMGDAFELCSEDAYEGCLGAAARVINGCQMLHSAVETDTGRETFQSIGSAEPGARARILREFAAHVQGPLTCESASKLDQELRTGESAR